MQLACDELLARAALADDEDAAGNRGQARDRLTERLHGPAVADERAISIQTGSQRSQLADEPPPGHGVLDLLNHALDRLGLVDEPIRAEPDGLNAAIVAAGAGIDDHGRIDTAMLHASQHLEAIDPRHLEVEYHAVDRLPCEHVERLFTAGGDTRVIATDTLQVVGVLLDHCRHIVDDEHLGHVRAGPDAGISMRIRVPFPGALSTPIVPWRSMTSRRTIESPRPVPPSFVV